MLFGNGDVYIHWMPDFVQKIDRVAVKLHATRSDLIKFFVQEGFKKIEALSSQEHHKLMRAFENNEVLEKPKEVESEF